MSLKKIVLVVAICFAVVICFAALSTITPSVQSGMAYNLPDGRELCSSCNGDETIRCTSCNSGKVRCFDCKGTGRWQGQLDCGPCNMTGEVDHRTCNGTGNVRCKDCKGLGHVRKR